MSNKAPQGVFSLLRHMRRCIKCYVVNAPSCMHSAVCYLHRDLQCTLQSTEVPCRNLQKLVAGTLPHRASVILPRPSQVLLLALHKKLSAEFCHS